MEVLAVASTAVEAIAIADRERPDIILMDIGLPDQSGLAAGRAILEGWPDAKILALTALNDRAVLEEAMRIGFRGYLTKETAVETFVNAIHAVIDGRSVPTHVASRRGNGSLRRGDVTLMAEQLSSREREVLELLVRGASGAVVAERLGISRNTVRTHVQGILTKLQVHSRLEAATFAVKHAIVTLPLGDADEANKTGSA
jgi:two-component system nitrate/nitrite response regulator NarL